MLNFRYDDEQERLKTIVRARAIEELRPLAEQAEHGFPLPSAIRDSLMRFGLPGADGFAAERDPVAFLIAGEALAWADAGIAYAWLASRQVAWMIAACGTEEQKAAWLPRFAADPLLPASLYFLEGRGQAIIELETRISAVGNHIVVNGYKSPVAYPRQAQVSVIVGKNEQGVLSAVIAEGCQEAIRFHGAEDRRLALSACPMSSEARIESLELPADAAMHSDGLHRALTECRLVHAAICVGTAAAAADYAGHYARSRTAFGKPILSYQGVSFPLIDVLMEAEAAHIGMLQLATTRDMTDTQRERRASSIVDHANQLVFDAGREGVQAMGVAGVTIEHPQERAYRAAGVLATIDFDPLVRALGAR